MKIKHEFDYEADWVEIADEFTANDSDYQAQVLNQIGNTFKRWVEDETGTTTYLQMLEIAEGLDDDGIWLINFLHDYIQEVDSDEPRFPCIEGELAEMYVGNEWIKGRIVNGYRFCDGVVTIETDDGKRYWCGEDRTELYRPIEADKESDNHDNDNNT